jgi:hypothetical protein
MKKGPADAEFLTHIPFDSGTKDTVTSIVLPTEERSEDKPESPLLELPVELLMEIMSNCPSPVDLIKFTLTCKALRNIYESSHGSHSKQDLILFDAMSNLIDRFIGPVPGHCIAVTRYRKERHELGELSPRNVERHLKNGFLGLWAVDTNIDERWLMSDLCRISGVLEDAEVVVKELSTNAWWGRGLSGLPGVPSQHYKKTETLVLSRSEKARFLNSVFQYDDYCNMFFYEDNVLFNMNTPIRQRFFNKPGNNGKGDIIRFYSVVMFIYNYYRLVVETMTGGWIPETSTIGKDEERKYFRTAGCQEILRFVHYLVCQGIRLFVKVHAMDWNNRMELLLAKFYSLRDTHHPAISVHGIDFTGEGTHGDQTWTPWAHAREFIVPRYEPFLRSAYYFWDRERFSGEVTEAAL